ncbi:MAG TPA: MbcA/ParS/Xre antitoxin family protein, partial [Thermohalobaculum sp.]|nr:MbcA/ParS/Xre antitoxin family protein [Thermohalobaculum sp.]
DQPLKVVEADAIARIIRVRDHAQDTFGRRELAEIWLTEPNPELGGRSPIEMARTDLGAREVETVLGRIEHGVFS